MRKYADTRADRLPEMMINEELFMTCIKTMNLATHEFDMVGSKVINFHSIGSVLIAKLKTKSSQKTKMCEYKLDTRSHGNLMTIKMYKSLFPQTNMNE